MFPIIVYQINYVTHKIKYCLLIKTDITEIVLLTWKAYTYMYIHTYIHICFYILTHIYIQSLKGDLEGLLGGSVS